MTSGGGKFNKDRGGPRFYIAYWEAKQEDSVSLDGDAPNLCRSCRGVRRPWRFRLDNMQACIRSCGKERGILRQEIAEFWCLSPCSAITYEFSTFSNYLNNTNQKALTEETVIGTALRVHQGAVTSVESGVRTEHFRLSSEYSGWDDWLYRQAARLRASADLKGRRTVAIMLDSNGEEIITLGSGVDKDGEPAAGIESVVIVLGGPDGLKPDIQRKFDDILSSVLHDLVSISLPGGRQHSNVALADLLLAHDRRALIPAVEYLLRSGPELYAKWRLKVLSLLEMLQGRALEPQQAVCELDECIKLLRHKSPGARVSGQRNQAVQLQPSHQSSPSKSVLGVKPQSQGSIQDVATKASKPPNAVKLGQRDPDVQRPPSHQIGPSKSMLGDKSSNLVDGIKSNKAPNPALVDEQVWAPNLQSHHQSDPSDKTFGNAQQNQAFVHNGITKDGKATNATETGQQDEATQLRSSRQSNPSSKTREDSPRDRSSVRDDANKDSKAPSAELAGQQDQASQLESNYPSSLPKSSPGDEATKGSKAPNGTPQGRDWRTAKAAGGTKDARPNTAQTTRITPEEVRILHDVDFGDFPILGADAVQKGTKKAMPKMRKDPTFTRN